MQVLIGFVIALCVGLTGVGGGSFTAPALVLLAGLSGVDAVGTALVYSMVVRVAAAPFYVAGKQVHFRYLCLMLLGALPGLAAGSYFLATLNTRRWNHVVLVMLGVTLIGSSILTIAARKARLNQQRSGFWLPWLTFPIGVETGFSSAGAGALGTMLLFNCEDMPANRVVGTDLLFGIALAGVGALFHFSVGSISGSSLKELLTGGIPGVFLGCILAPRLPVVRLKSLIVGITFLLGLQLIWNGVRVWH
ncbi:MAG TPA: sulfite exporter TauE/SafE family protein [Candidatus Angelobacter sp.]|nr:sulfite exporter TauE/SafE family protein [Candidatus Angelobacter sp.]